MLNWAEQFSYAKARNTFKYLCKTFNKECTAETKIYHRITADKGKKNYALICKTIHSLHITVLHIHISLQKPHKLQTLIQQHKTIRHTKVSSGSYAQQLHFTKLSHCGHYQVTRQSITSLFTLLLPPPQHTYDVNKE